MNTVKPPELLNANVETGDDDKEEVPVLSFGRKLLSDSIKLAKDSAQERSAATTVASSGDLSVTGAELTSALSVGSHNSEVKFGNVRIHTHRMTLGDNPEAKGTPVTIDWEVQESEELDIDSYEENQWNSGKDRSVHRIDKRSRDKIALEHHSRESIVKVQNEIMAIKLSREASEREDVRKAIVKEEKRHKRDQRKHPIMRLLRRNKSS
ncbi:hypothetical protein ACA910_020145 [Epithemia clementina (nom. ined.)]